MALCPQRNGSMALFFGTGFAESDDMTITKEQVLQAVARGWCHEQNAYKTMDADLACAIADEVFAAFEAGKESAVSEPTLFNWKPSFSKTQPDSTLLAELTIHHPDGQSQTLFAGPTETHYYTKAQLDEAYEAGKTDAAAVSEPWQPIETAPKDGTELIGWREDCGQLLIRWTSCSELMTDAEIEKSGIDEEILFVEDWFYADIVRSGRLEGSEIPTHWMPLPPPPNIGVKE